MVVPSSGLDAQPKAAVVSKGAVIVAKGGPQSERPSNLVVRARAQGHEQPERHRNEHDVRGFSFDADVVADPAADVAISAESTEEIDTNASLNDAFCGRPVSVDASAGIVRSVRAQGTEALELRARGAGR
jgi:hypothetical protein